MKRSKACGLARATGTPTYTYVYDRFGNRWQQNSPAGSIYTSSFTFTGNSGSNTNRLDGYSYDSAGNLLYDNVHHYFYDAENRLMQVDGTLPYCTSNGASGNAATSCYYYDAEGHRVHRTGIDENPCNNDGNGGSGDFAFDLDGNWTVRTNSTGGACASEIYLGGRHFGTSAGNINFDHTDWLGTSRLRNSTSTITSGYEACTSLPFGDGLLCNSTYGSNIHFTGKEHDYESGLDNFGARYNASTMGRFMSPDPLLNSGHPSNPQTWNRYSYALNNPLKIVDPNGLYNVNCGDDKECKQAAKDLKKGLTDLQKKVDKMKDGPEKQRLEASLKALGTEGDKNDVNVKFGANSDGAAGNTQTVADKTGALSFNVTLDPSKISGGTNYWGIDAAHEGTHVSDISDPRYANLPTSLSDFSLEYRGYQTSAWAAQALGVSPLQYADSNGTNVIWNSSWGAADRQTLMDKGITQHVTSIPGHQEMTPHNPWPN